LACEVHKSEEVDALEDDVNTRKVLLENKVAKFEANANGFDHGKQE
jgi:hypothetical protein